ncbi:MULTISPECIES: choline/carnitine O-acyltransferase [Sporosarcina]|uniref:choline/carnitine O-acyltransferase n=1 Tax=Sporosarcina TaxID=1569 RepID=UPI000A17EFE2|nr:MULTISPECIES: choline/carnitine O-acyltransferase [Sporosarcina]ARK20489.1 hypothetical protein SporoP32a_02355 [Sporosarcina ureae]
MMTFEFQECLPSLPIPELEDTKRKLLEAIEPLISEGEFHETKKVVQQFFEENGDARRLQEKLGIWRDNAEGSWLKPFWDDVYLTYRGPLHIGSNFNVLVENQHYAPRTVAEVAGKVGRSIAEFYHSILAEETPPEMVRGVPLDMSQYPNFFRTVRVPKLHRDEHYVAEPSKVENYISLMINGNVYLIPVTNSQGIIYSSKALSIVIEGILSLAEPAGPNVGIFTTASRNEAASIYEQLLVSEVNAESLQKVADSLVVLSIDKESMNSNEALQNLVFSGRNKYFDKTLQIVITEAGELGYSIEHTAMDGTTIFAVIQYVQEQLMSIDQEDNKTNEQPVAKKLEWVLSAEIIEKLSVLEVKNDRTIQHYVINVQNFDAFGTDEIKRLGFSPDSFFHMALQVAQYKTFGMMRSTYEAVSMRLFNEGRTECIRPSSSENLALAKAIVVEQQEPVLIYQLMQKAGSAHSIRLKEAKKGFGVERHLYGLQRIFETYQAELDMEKFPALFTDPGYLTMRHDFISTSNMTSPEVKSCAFGPVVEDGYGIFYVLLKDRLIINLSSYSRNEEKARLLAENLDEALKELRGIALAVM